MDLQKLQIYHSELTSFKANLDNKASGLSEELEASGLRVKTLKKEQLRVQCVLSTQKFTPANIERINWEKSGLQQTINSLSKSLEQTEQHMWKEEIALAKVKETAEVKVAEYHKLDHNRIQTIDYGKQLREQIRRVEEQLEHHIQEKAGEDQKFAAEMEDAENHRKLLEKKVTLGYDDAVEELKAAKQQYQIVLQETKEEWRTLANNLASVLTTTVNHLSVHCGEINGRPIQ
ncbi:unnamed protein product [Coregonus sp. 'balchen']|nr:unnamed protein product [Coregonus sp. 'balchen']